MATWTQESVLGLAREFMRSRVLLTAAELDLFTLLSGDPLPVEGVARALGGEPRGTAILLDALAAMGLLEKREERYRCPAEVAALLAAGPPASVLPMVLHAAGLWERWSALSAVVREGWAPGSPSRPFSERDRERFVGAMHVIGRSLAGSVVAALPLDGVGRVLDVGGASGTYAEAFLEARPQLRVTLFDLAPVVELARRRLEGRGLLSRVALVAGDFYQDELPPDHDLAFLSAIIHQNSPAQNLALYRKVHRALRPGGVLAIRDHLLSEDRTQPPSGALFAVNMLVVTAGGNSYTYPEIRDQLREAGFESVRRVREDGGRMDGVVTCVKPAPPP